MLCCKHPAWCGFGGAFYAYGHKNVCMPLRAELCWLILCEYHYDTAVVVEDCSGLSCVLALALWVLELSVLCTEGVRVTNGSVPEVRG